MTLFSAENLSLAFGTHVLLDNASFSLEAGTRICLIGRNGAGKTTLLKIIMGAIQPDDGEIHRNDVLKITWLAQDVPHEATGTVFDVVAGGLGETGRLLKEYHHLTLAVAENHDPALMTQLEDVQHALEARHGWNLVQQVEETLSRLDLPADEMIESLSGGLKRRVMLAKALVSNPDILLLDEPTNHLDINSILWLEGFLKNFAGCIVFITHDRVFLQQVATDIMELDRGKLTLWPGDYQNYLRRREERWLAEEKANAKFDKKLAEEEVWIRQGIKARRTRNEGRVRALKAMREQSRERRYRTGNVRMALDEGWKSGKIVIEADNISYAWAGKPIVSNFSTLIQRGDRVGVIGPNGCGKSTLLKLLLGELKPDTGKVKIGTKLDVAYFDQFRGQLEEEKSVLENVGKGKDYVTVQGRQRHVYGYLRDFLFSAERARTPVKVLSGGERNRLLLARLFTKPVNLMVLDEPTNDLDSDTLELLESLLMDYDGTLIVVSHDRGFLDNIVTSTIVFEHNELSEYVGGYSDWITQREERKQFARQSDKIAVPEEKEKPQAKIKKKLSYKQTQELAELPHRIEALEEEQAKLQEETSRPDFYQQEQSVIKERLDRFGQLSEELEHAYQRWDELENFN